MRKSEFHGCPSLPAKNSEIVTKLFGETFGKILPHFFFFPPRASVRSRAGKNAGSVFLAARGEVFSFFSFL